MSELDELKEQVALLRAEVLGLRRQIGTTGMRLGPQPLTPEEEAARAREMSEWITKAIVERTPGQLGKASETETLIDRLTALVTQWRGQAPLLNGQLRGRGALLLACADQVAALLASLDQADGL